jgi:hypothetical protein
LFLALASSEDEPPPLWDVITFNAETFGADPFRYLTVGIKGGFLGRYGRVEYHEKTREYGVIADRDLWLIQLTLSKEERSQLERLLAEAEDEWFPYTFFIRNCAYYLQSILSAATGALSDPSGITSPTGVFQEVQDSRIGGPTFFRPAASRRLLAIGDNLSETVKQELKTRPWREIAADTLWHNRLQSEELAFVLEFVSLRMEETSTRLASNEEAGLANLRLRAISNFGLEERSFKTDPQRPIPDPSFHEYSRLRLSQGLDETSSGRTYLSLRGALHDESDPWFGHRPLTTLDMLSVELSSPSTELIPRLESAVLFSQRALSPGDWVRGRASWMLEMQARRGGVFSEDGVHFEVRSGSGGTWAFPFNTYGYALFTTGIVGDWGRGIDFTPGAEVGFLALPHDRARVGFRWSHERRISEWSTHYSRITAWAKVDLSARWGLMVRMSETGSFSSWLAGFDWYL